MLGHLPDYFDAEVRRPTGAAKIGERAWTRRKSWITEHRLLAVAPLLGRDVSVPDDERATSFCVALIGDTQSRSLPLGWPSFRARYGEYTLPGTNTHALGIDLTHDRACELAAEATLDRMRGRAAEVNPQRQLGDGVGNPLDLADHGGVVERVKSDGDCDVCRRRRKQRHGRCERST